jgi:hypothetical protein
MDRLGRLPGTYRINQSKPGRGVEIVPPADFCLDLEASDQQEAAPRF